MKIIFFGSPHFVIPVLEALTKHYDVLAVVTSPDKKVGRKQLLTPSPIKQFALQHNISVLEMESIKLRIENEKVDLFIVAAYGKIIPKEILDLPKYGAINIHPSELPKYRGPSPITQTLLNGDKTSAITFMQMDKKMDHGPILTSIPYEIHDNATTQTLTQDMFQKSADLLPEIIDDYITGKIKPIPQNNEEATYTKLITKQDGYINLDSPPAKEQLNQMIKAYFPWPNVWSKIKINDKELLIKFLPENRLQLEGGKSMSAKDFFNGYPELKNTIQKLVG
jgi:methionyl-tRNA formyltransferase